MNDFLEVVSNNAKTPKFFWKQTIVFTRKNVYLFMKLLAIQTDAEKSGNCSLANVRATNFRFMKNDRTVTLWRGIVVGGGQE